MRTSQQLFHSKARIKLNEMLIPQQWITLIKLKLLHGLRTKTLELCMGGKILPDVYLGNLCVRVWLASFSTSPSAWCLEHDYKMLITHNIKTKGKMGL